MDHNLLQHPMSSQNVLHIPIDFRILSDELSRRGIWQHRAANLSDFIATGYLYPALAALSLLSLLASILFPNGLFSRKIKLHTSSVEVSKPTRRSHTPLKYSITQIVVFSAALSLAAVSASQNGIWVEPAVLGYVLLLGVLQFAWKSNAFSLLLNRQTNSLVAIITILEAIRLLLPVAIMGSNRRPSRIECAKLGCLAFTLIISFITPREMRSQERNVESSVAEEMNEKYSPEETCSWYSYYMSYGWLTYLTVRGFFRDLSIDDLPPLPSYDAPTTLLQRMNESRLKGGRTIRTLCLAFRNDIKTIMAWAVTTAMVEYLAPCAMYNLLSYLENPSESTAIVHPFVWISLLFIGPVARSVCYQRSIFVGTRLLVLVKATMIQEIYQTMMGSHVEDSLQGQADTNSQDQSIDESGDASTNGVRAHSAKMESLLSYDADSISNATDIFYALTASTLSAIIAMTFLYQLLGWPSLIGVGVLLSLSPLPALFSGRQSRLHRFVMETTDSRLSKISEYLHSIRTLKFFAWEDVASKTINAIRATEQQRIWKRNITSMLIAMTGDMLSLVSLLAMFTSLVLFTDTPLRAPAAFTALALTETLRAQFVWLSKVAQWVAQAYESVQRVDKFFDSAVEMKRHPAGPPEFKNATFRLSSSSSFRLRNLSISFHEKALNIATGPTGSGKTSLLLSLLGETSLESGTAACPPDVSYVPQTAWLQNNTIRQNILFYTPYDERRYRQILHACDLVEDITQFPLGDLTHVGEQGSSLSGGQKQRISLARALYSPSSTLLLDDIFSALDAHTALRVYERCFRSGLLSDRTVILVTHFSTAIDDAEVLVSLDHGEVSFTKINPGRPPSYAKSSWVTHAEEMEEESGSQSTPSPQSGVTFMQGEVTEISLPEENLGGAEVDEKRASGRVPRGFIVRYMLLFGGYSAATLTIINTILVQLAYFSITFWLSIWTGLSTQDDYPSKAIPYLLVYIGTVLAFISLQFLNNYIYQRGGWKAAKTMHERLVTAILGAPISWYDNTPVGRIINRFGVDIQSMDSALVDWLRMSLDNGIRLALRLASIASIMPIFALPAGIFCMIGFATGEVYARAQISIKRLCAVKISPVFSHFSDTTGGLAVIRARQPMDTVFQTLLADKLAVYMRALEAQYNTNRWVSIRSDFCAATIAVTAGCIAYYKSGSPGLVGFSLTNAIGLSQTILTLVRNMNELEVELNSFQRISEYAEIEPEAEPKEEELKAGKIPASWPATGNMEFRNVTARYSETGPDILRNVSFRAQPGQRIAIIGRTGSGKSTITRSILRSTDVVSGGITIDGIDVRNIPLKRLRSSISFVPQDAVIFSGDIRSNLDPENTLDETELQAVLTACSLIQTRGVDTGSGLSVHAPVASGGKNFSNGQRQILGLARAMCRRSKVVILDEATASVDHETDVRMQRLIRSEFAGSTIITIAHRLRTIIDYDQVVVMDEGKVLETGSPADLIDKEGTFWGMLRNSGEYEELVSLAREGSHD
ncbi:abc transporter [Annulohypoxylon maeteangense]|uniref:abc transporter n=1 Tax=Annulohypoxylon maeteangense TaxID=1927788 RepID=UPI002008980B|nr:abc transporter [Annulohypoxylon maeteangense]KAI0889275.1 abc transporter [Annulohypoxylon maeteangense]